MTRHPNPDGVIRVFLADDHALFRAGVRKILDETPGLTVVGEAGDGNDVLKRAAVETWDVLVLDLGLPGVGGMEILRRLRESRPELRVLVVSMQPEERYAARLVGSGAAGYLAKGRSAQELVDAVRRVAAGGSYVTANVARQRPPKGAPGALPHEELSEREHQVFTLLVQGKSPSDVANELDLGASTVSTYIHRIKERLKVQTIAELVRYASDHGLL